MAPSTGAHSSISEPPSTPEPMAVTAEIMWAVSKEILDDQHCPKGSVCEIYSPSRVEPVAQAAGFGMGKSFDITTVDEHGVPWDFSKPARRQKVLDYIAKERPMLVVGSPMCKMFSKLQRLSIT